MTRMRLRRLMCLLAAMACSGSSEPCVRPPCALPPALNVSVKSRTTGAPVTVTLDVSGATVTSLSCDGSCLVPGSAGTYHIKMSAPGYATAETDVKVNGTFPDCGCPSADPVSLTMLLTPTE